MALTPSDANTRGCVFRFKALLAPFGPDGTPRKKIEISDVKYNVFQVKFLFLNLKPPTINVR